MSTIGTSVERRLEGLEDLKQARELAAHTPKGYRRHKYIDRLAHDVRVDRLDFGVFEKFMRIVGGRDGIR